MVKMKITVKDRNYFDFKEALKTIDINNSGNIDIFIDGVVEGQNIIDKPNITIHGGEFRNNFGAYEIMSDGKKRGTFNSYTLYVNANNVSFVGTKIINTAGENNGQAIALMIDGDNTIVKDSFISSYHDTLFIGPLPEKEFEKDGFKGPMKDKERITKHVCLDNCLIEGSVDFIFGSGFAYLNKCKINSLAPGYVFAPSTKENEKYGFVVMNCEFVSPLKEECVYLARPWRNNAKLIITDSSIGKHIFKEGYTDWNKDMSTVEFKEDGEINQRKYAKKINDEDYKMIQEMDERLRKLKI